MPHTPDEIARKGRDLYERKIRPQVEQNHHGEVVVIDVDSGDYEIASDHLTAARRARAKHPDAALFALRVGFPALARIGWPRDDEAKMITGRVTRTPEAIVGLTVGGSQGKFIEIETILDTGFTDYLTLPNSIITELRLPRVDTVECQLADGRIVAMDTYQAMVQWHGSPREILAFAAEGDPLLGMSLLYGSRVTLDVLENRELRIEPID